MIGSPLLIGCDLAALDAFTRNLLVNDEVIAVSQDRLGMAARRIRHTDAESVWTRPLVDGSLAVALVNRYPLAREIKVPFLDLGLGGGQRSSTSAWAAGSTSCATSGASAARASIPASTP